MANRFWVAGTGNWSNSNTANWSASSGGAGGASVPTTTDNVIFDSLSNATAYTVTVTTNTFTSISLTVGAPASGQVSFTGAFSISISGSTNMSGGTAGINWMHTGNFSQGASGSGTITSNGIIFGGGFIRNQGGTATLGDDLQCVGQITATTGTFNANNKNITASSIACSSGTLTLGSGTHTLTGTGTVFNITGTATITASTGTIKCTNTANTAITFAGGGKTYNNVWFSRGASTASITISGSNTFTDLKDDGTVAHSINFTISTTQTVSTFTVSGTAGNLITIQSTSGGTPFSLSKSSGIVSVDYLSIKDSDATGGAAWYAGANSVNTSGNTGWIFTVPPIVAEGAFLFFMV